MSPKPGVGVKTEAQRYHEPPGLPGCRCRATDGDRRLPVFFCDGISGDGFPISGDRIRFYLDRRGVAR